MEPRKYYSTIFIWNGTSGQFVCYYINFQLPFRRTPLGFDTLDLDLDLIIDPSLEWEWKDEVEYQDGIRAGGIKAEWVREVEQAKIKVFERIEKHAYPLTSPWLNWKPDSSWELPFLPENWDEVYF
jgi:protein associated with RNAse G/E